MEVSTNSSTRSERRPTPYWVGRTYEGIVTEMTTDLDPVEGGATETQPPRAIERRDRTRLTLAVVVGALVAIFSLLNLNDVKVHWLFASGETPLILVIVLAFALGVVVDRLVLMRRRKRRAAAP